VIRAVITGVAAAAATRLAFAALKRYPPGGEKTWARVNHRGEPVTLLEGPATALGAVAASALLSPSRPGSPSVVSPLAIAGTGAAAFGVLDDLKGSGKRRGLRGHLGALAHGEVTTGAVKLLGIGVTGLASALAQGGGPADVMINTGLVAGSANLVNLFDLRPGRAIKVVAVSGALIGTGAAAPLGAAVAMAPVDLAEQAMLGDAGANALGAMLGAAAAASLPRPARTGVLGAIVALTVASEKISFTKVIERTAPLRWLDMLGRRPPAAVSPAAVSPAEAVPGGTSQRQAP
jgi:UDP-GlcNAc:undecaprenyl-phosphate/decaprenyl-phosphate GlcNAc-1-phosphate transferase